MQDHRRHARKKAFLTAYVNLGGRRHLPCMVRDLSQTGARIRFAASEWLPEMFDLHINGRDRVMRVEAVWRTATEVGVRLLAKVPIGALPPDRPTTRPTAPFRPAIHVDAGEMRG